MATFTNEEYADILMAYGRANCVAREAQRIYQNRYPGRRLPSRYTFSNTYRRVRETGNLKFCEPRINQRQHGVAVEEQILELFDEDPTRSIRNVAEILNLNIWTIWSVLRANGKYAFHYTPVQGLEGGDYERRIRFCRFLLHSDVDDRDFLRSILWTDECQFNREGIVNFHNEHYWSNKTENPRVKRPISFQRKFSVNVWAGVIGNILIGPHYLPANLNGNSYLEFLQNDLPDLLNEVPIIDEDRSIIFQNDGCPAHYRLTVREHLDNVFPNSWIGREGPIPWPARSPDLTPLDFYVWGRAKALVYGEEIRDRDHLIQRINAAFARMRGEMQLRTTTVEIRNRCHACIRNQGHQFEQDL